MRGPRLPAGAASQLSRPYCAAPAPPSPRGHPASGFRGSLGARVAGWGWGCPARAALCGRARVWVLSGNGGERVPAREVGGACCAQGSAAGMRGAGLRARAVPGCHRAAAEGRGHTHPGRPGSPPPGRPRGRAAGRGAVAGLGLGAARGRRAARECLSVARAAALAPALELPLPASPGAAAADILRRAGEGSGAAGAAGKWRSRGAWLAGCPPGFACDWLLSAASPWRWVRAGCA